MDEDEFYRQIKDSNYSLSRAKILLDYPVDLRRLKEAHKLLSGVIHHWEYLEEQYVGNLRATSRSY